MVYAVVLSFFTTSATKHDKINMAGKCSHTSCYKRLDNVSRGHVWATRILYVMWLRCTWRFYCSSIFMKINFSYIKSTETAITPVTVCATKKKSTETKCRAQANSSDGTPLKFKYVFRNFAQKISLPSDFHEHNGKDPFGRCRDQIFGYRCNLHLARMSCTGVWTTTVHNIGTLFWWSYFVSMRPTRVLSVWIIRVQRDGLPPTPKLPFEPTTHGVLNHGSQSAQTLFFWRRARRRCSIWASVMMIHHL
jgi:hypothetical protein